MSSWESTGTSAGVSHETSENAEIIGNPVRDSCIKYSRRTQRRKCHSLSELSQHLEEGVVAKEWMLSALDENSNGTKGKMTYFDMKRIIERKLAYQKKGFLSEHEIQESVKEFQDLRSEEELDSTMVRNEV